MIEFAGNTIPMPIMIPFSPTTQVTAATDRVFIGLSDTYEIGMYTPAGSLTTLIRRRHEPRRVTEDEITEYRARLTEVIVQQDNPIAEPLQEAYANVPYPETMPAFGEFQLDAEGNLWVAEPMVSPDEARRWSVFDPEGRWLGDVTTPARFAVREIGTDYVLGQTSDEMETERVLLYRLQKSSSEMQ
jgi:hypothetical protein